MIEARRFAGQRMVLTGASSGIGRALALELGEGGALLTLLGRRRDALLGVQAEVRARGGAAELALADLTDDAALDAALEPLVAEAQGLDALLHAAGVVTLGAVAEAPLADLDWNLRVNLRAPYRLTQALLPRLLAAKGQVVFVNSGAGLAARAGWGAYAISKHGLKALADALREEVKPKGMRVLSVFPGRTATPMQARVRALEGQPYQPEDFIRPEDVSVMVCQALALPRSADVIELNLRPPG
jgi:NAD(P)-dependent dehydrogenase (short-subunit alcohol dehydrogenase family)